MKRIHGRIDEPSEFVEYRPDTGKRRISIVIQKAGASWNIYKVWPGTKGKVQTLHRDILTLDIAETLGRAEAILLFD